MRPLAVEVADRQARERQRHPRPQIRLAHPLQPPYEVVDRAEDESRKGLDLARLTGAPVR
jgi:hypothetical protein